MAKGAGAQSVPGPAQFSQRTDQAPGQPVRVPVGLPYGSAKQLEQAQSAVPLPGGGPSSPAGASAGPAPSAPQGQGPEVGPPQGVPPNILDILSHQTQRPNEPVTTPSSQGNKVVPTQQILQALEHLIGTSDSVPANVMKLYQGLRQEANRGFGP